MSPTQIMSPTQRMAVRFRYLLLVRRGLLTDQSAECRHRLLGVECDMRFYLNALGGLLGEW